MAPSITFLPGPDFGELLLVVSEFADGAGREDHPEVRLVGIVKFELFGTI
jgi:hypothetical protein